ncbi:hypothetical protein JD844_010515 [Phrynosoma platyrhinos]|uniref:GRIP1 associated protein 1 n=1 Tax=Phrynosoma platyrhinos TaxID=52577 RepID=A0ABQ7THJ9_PHRPL|nr:hypothetical protein JD844_010515 [Phrynosoma platyrhinos]
MLNGNSEAGHPQDNFGAHSGSSALQERYEKEVARQAENRDTGKGDASVKPPPAGQEGMEPQISDGGGGSSSASQQLLSEVELKWQTEREEKILLKEQLQSLEAAKTTEMSRLQQELSKLSEKLKKKQESFLRLQTEKEALYNDSRTKIDEIQQRKEDELNQVLLTSFLSLLQHGFSELKDQLQSRRKEHEVALQALQDQVACQSAESQEQVETILSENDALRTNLAALEQIQTSKTQEMNLMRDQVAALESELQQCQNEKEALAAQRDDLNTQLEESLRANTRLLEQLQELGQEKERLLQDLEETRKTAEKRKGMLDELAIETLQEKGRHKEEISNLRLQHEKEVLAVRARYERELRELHEHKKRQEDELRGQLKEEKARSQELESMQQTVEELRLQIQSMDGTKGWFERRLKEAEELIEKHQQEHAEALQACKEHHASDLQIGRAIESGSVTSLSPWQEVKDTVDGQRILEKKGSAALKDLKRQLHLERKRADKLQERLQEILTNSKSRTGSPQSQSQPPRPADLSDEEISELFQRLAEVQQEKWLLEEKAQENQEASPRRYLMDMSRSQAYEMSPESQAHNEGREVKHLEVSSASMAEDLCRKSAIIETYVMDSRIGEESDVQKGSSLARPSFGGYELSLRCHTEPQERVTKPEGHNVPAPHPRIASVTGLAYEWDVFVSSVKPEVGDLSFLKPVSQSGMEDGLLCYLFPAVLLISWLSRFSAFLQGKTPNLCQPPDEIRSILSFGKENNVSGAHGQVDRSSLSSVLRDLVKPGDENLREMNKKLQNMLEEQLTKNMHLQKDLEVLSQEIVRLSKECVPSPDAEPTLDDAV